MTHDAGNLADGEWHRLHPATPLLRGGIALIAILGIVIANLRERLVETALRRRRGYDGDPLDVIVERGLDSAGVSAVLAVGFILFIGGFYLSWRMHTFRITDELVEVRSGILFRTNRKGRLDRIQGINIVRPLFARLFGAARLEVNVAGSDGNVQLAYLRAAGRRPAARHPAARLGHRGDRTPRAAGAGSDAGTTASFVEQRVAELIAPELDPGPRRTDVDRDDAPGSTDRIDVAQRRHDRLRARHHRRRSSCVDRLRASSSSCSASSRCCSVSGSYLVNRIVKSLRYTIAGTPDGVRVGFGLLSTSNETLPPGRIHSISISQPLLWRPADWWEIKVNRAGKSSAQGAAVSRTRRSCRSEREPTCSRCSNWCCPGLFDGRHPRDRRGRPREGDRGRRLHELPASGGDSALVLVATQRVRAATPDAVILRRGAIWRELVVVPTARMQSVALKQGPLERALRLGQRAGPHRRRADHRAARGARRRTTRAASSATLSHDGRRRGRRRPRHTAGGRAGADVTSPSAPGRLGVGIVGAGRVGPGARCSARRRRARDRRHHRGLAGRPRSRGRDAARACRFSTCPRSSSAASSCCSRCPTTNSPTSSRASRRPAPGSRVSSWCTPRPASAPTCSPRRSPRAPSRSPSPRRWRSPARASTSSACASRGAR